MAVANVPDLRKHFPTLPLRFLEIDGRKASRHGLDPLLIVLFQLRPPPNGVVIIAETKVYHLGAMYHDPIGPGAVVCRIERSIDVTSVQV